MRGLPQGDSLRHLVSSSGVRIATLPLTVLAGFATTRALISYVGIDSYGAISLIIALPALLPWADLGVGSALTTAIAASPDPLHDESIRAVTRKCLVATTASALVIIVISGALAGFGVLDDLLGVQGFSNASLAAWLVLVVFALGVPLSLGYRRLVGLGRNHIAIGLTAAVPVLTLGLVYAAHASGIHSLWFALSSAISSTAAAAGSWMLTRRWVISQRGPKVTTQPETRLRSTALPMLVISVGLPLAFQFDRILISHRAGLTALAMYSVAAQLYTPLWATNQVIGQAMWPFFVRLRITGGEVRRAWFRFLSIFLIASTGFGALYVLLGPYVIGFLTEDRLSVGTVLLVSFAALLVVQSTHLVDGMLLTRPDELRKQAVAVVAMTVLNLGLGWWWAGTSLGATGPVLASVTAVFACQLLPGLVQAARAVEGHGLRLDQRTGPYPSG